MEAKKNNTGIIIGSIVGTIALLIVLIGGFSIHESNSINRKYQNVKMQYAQVETVLQRRYDLIPNLANAVRGSMKQERDVFGAIAKARTQYNNASTPSEKFKASRALDRSTNVLINTIHEKYPRLESNDQVSKLMQEVEGSENRISTERQNYNGVVSDYNTTITSFPGSMFAGGHKEMPYFKADPQAKKAPKVNLE